MELAVVPGVTHEIYVQAKGGCNVGDVLYTKNDYIKPSSIVTSRDDSLNAVKGIFVPVEGSILIIDTGQGGDTYDLTVSFGDHTSNVAIDGVNLSSGDYVMVKLGSQHTLTFDMDGAYRLYDLQWRDGTGGDAQHLADVTTKAYDEYSDVWHCSVDVTILDEEPVQPMLLYIQPVAATQVTGTLNMSGNLGSWESDAPGGFFVGDTVTFTFTPNSGYKCESATSGGVSFDVVVDSTGKGTLTYTIGGNFTINVNFSQKVNATVTKNATGCTIDTYPNQPIVGLPCSVIVTPSSDSKQCATLTHNGNNILSTVDSMGMGTGSFTPGSGSNVLTATVEDKPDGSVVELSFTDASPVECFIDDIDWEKEPEFPTGSEHVVTIHYPYELIVCDLNNYNTSDPVEYSKSHWVDTDGEIPKYLGWSVTFNAVAGETYAISLNPELGVDRPPARNKVLWIPQSYRGPGPWDTSWHDLLALARGEHPCIIFGYINREVTLEEGKPVEPDFACEEYYDVKGDTTYWHIGPEYMRDCRIRHLDKGDVVHLVIYPKHLDEIIVDATWPTPTYEPEEGEKSKSMLTNMYIKPMLAFIDFVVDEYMCNTKLDCPIWLTFEKFEWKEVGYEEIGKLECKREDIERMETKQAYLDY